MYPREGTRATKSYGSRRDTGQEAFGFLSLAVEESGMGYTTASIDDTESVIPTEWGGMWFLRDALDAEKLGFTALELEPGGKGKEHDHGEEAHEEIYYVVEGELEVDIGSETVHLGEQEAIRVDPGQQRQLHNRGDEPVRIVIAGAP